MTDSEETPAGLARADFIVRYITDFELGRLKSDDVYLRLHPGFETVIEQELRRLRARLGGPPAGTIVESAGRPTLPVGPGPGPPAEPSEPRTPADAPGAWTLGRYRVERELGRGGQGSVHLAWDTNLGRRVALKILKAAWTGSGSIVRRFELEARALARLDHPGLAAIHDAGSVLGLEYVAMPYVEGHTLAEEIARRAATPPHAAEDAPGAAVGRAAILRYVGLLEKAARALHVAHGLGLVHRDIKPGNVMITPEDAPVLLDFGIARLESEPSDLTLTGDVLGTPGFMAPEQVAGQRFRIDRRTDVYGLGATLHEALTAGAGRRRDAVPSDPGRGRPPARRQNPAVGRDLDAVLQAALDPDPDRRYATASLFADDLARVRLGFPVEVRPPGRLRKSARWCRRRPAAAALVLFTPVALAAGLSGLALKNREIGAALQESGEKTAVADAAAALARDRFAAFQRLDDLSQVAALEEREPGLCPPHPERIAAMERWLADAREVVSRLGAHREALAALRRRGVPFVDRRPGIDPAMDRILHVVSVRDAARAELDSAGLPGERRADLTRIVAEAEGRLPVLEKEVAARPAFRFDDVEDRWLHDNLAELVSRLEALSAPSLSGATVAGMTRRLETAGSLERISLRETEASWREVVADLANPPGDSGYGELKLEPVLGLVPIGRDPRSGLWEFAHVLSGAPPARDAAGGLVLSEESSIVLVLVPGGVFTMGARPPRAGEEPRENVDPAARVLEQPVHEVTLDPFFISKYEMTQAQWQRAAGMNPSHARPDRQWEHGYRPTLLNPVENVAFEECEEVLRRLGLVLPTEAQWEYAARGGTSTPWWPGATRESFLTAENLADLTLAEMESFPGGFDADRRDGWSGPAPVGTYAPNPFGLHDVIGNVAELCRDWMAFYSTPVLPGDGLRIREPSGNRPVRGGAFNLRADDARSAWRRGIHATSRNASTGVRPALLVRDP